MSIPNTAIPFPQDTRTAIKGKIEEAGALFPILEPVSPDERDGLQTIAEGREPYVADAFTDARDNPKTVPTIIDMAQWALLEEQFDGLAEMESLYQAKLDLITGMKIVCGAARYANARRYYRYLQDNLDSLPGAESIFNRLGKLFSKQGNGKPKAPVAQESPK